MVLEQNLFGVETLLPSLVLRGLGEEEMGAYRRPFLRPGEDRRPILTFARQLPVDGEPADVTAIVSGYADWLRQSRVPKLFINGDPGAILVGSRRDFCRTWPNQTEVTVPGLHFLQEDAPAAIGQAITDWLPAIREARAA
jgi:haloalkane dehalogenase